MKCNMSHTPAGWTSGESADCTSLGSSIRIDGFPAVNLKIMQDVNAFCFGIDAVLLSDFADKSVKLSVNYDEDYE